MSASYIQLEKNFIKPSYIYTGSVLGFIMGEVNLFFMIFPFSDFFVTFGRWINLTSVTNAFNSLFAAASVGYLIVAKRVPAKWRNAFFLLLFTAFIVCSYLWTDSVMQPDAKNAIRRTVFTIFQTLAIVTILFEKGDEYVFTVLKRFAIIIAIMSTLSIALFPSESSWTIDDSGRKQAFFSSPNNLGQFLSFAFLIINFYKRTEFKWYIVVLLNAMLIYNAIECDSKTSMSGAIVCVVLYHLRFLIIPFLIFVIGAGLYLPIYTKKFEKGKAEKIDFAKRDLTFTGRSDVWAIMQRDIKNTDKATLGFGLGGYWGEKVYHPKANIHQLDWAPHQGHNGYLDIQIHLGLVGLFLFFLFLIEYFGTIFKKMNNLNITMLFVSVIFCINNITETSFFRGKHFFFVLLMIFYWYCNFKDKERVVIEEDDEDEVDDKAYRPLQVPAFNKP